MINYDTNQADLVLYLQNCALFVNTFIFAVKEGNIQSEVNKALSGLKSINGKSGSSIEVGKPFLVDSMTEAPGPTAVIENRFLVKTQPTINLGPNGSGLPTEQLSAGLIQALLEWGSEGSQAGSFVPSGNFDSPAHFGESSPFEGRLVVMRCKIAFTPLPRTITPVLAGDTSAVSIAVAAPDAAAPVLFTIDGTMPGFSQGTANPAGTSVLYTAPFAVPSGAVVRAMAIAPGKLPSIVNYSTIT